MRSAIAMLAVSISAQNKRIFIVRIFLGSPYPFMYATPLPSGVLVCGRTCSTELFGKVTAWRVCVRRPEVGNGRQQWKNGIRSVGLHRLFRSYDNLILTGALGPGRTW